MAHKPKLFDAAARDAHQRAYQASQTVAECFPAALQVKLELSFSQVDGVSKSSPYSRIFLPSMQAHFWARCPSQQCSGGGFDLMTAVEAAMNAPSSEHTSLQQCHGRQSGTACAVRLSSHVSVTRK